MNIELQDVIKNLTGRGGKLRSSKPAGKDQDVGLYQYVWRMVRWHAAIDTTMPVMCEFYFWNWFEAQVQRKVQCRDPEMLAARKEADDLVDSICKHFGLDPNGQARIWQRVMGNVK